MRCFKLNPVFPKGRKYFVFFTYGGKYEGRYAEIRARNHESAERAAWELYGYKEVAYIENDEAYALGRVRAYGLKELKVADYAEVRS